MNSKDLEIAKRIAEIEGIKVETYTNINGDLASVHEPQDENGWANVYNPFDWSILGPLMVKYGVLRPAHSFVVIHCDYGIARVDVDDDLPRAILECIIKSQEQ